MASFVYQNLHSQIVVTLWSAEQALCLMIYETKEIPDLYFANQTRFDLKSINGI